LARKPPDRTSKSVLPTIDPTRRRVTAADHIACRFLDHRVNMNDESCPRMPRIKDLALLGLKGVASSSCATAGDRIRALTASYFTELPIRMAA
jgi:hypothetical protein